MSETVKQSTKFECAECGVATIIHEGIIIRPCKHDTAGVLASMTAHAYGMSHFLKNEQLKKLG